MKDFDSGEHTQVFVDKENIKHLLRVNTFDAAETFKLSCFPSSLTQQPSRMILSNLIN